MLILYGDQFKNQLAGDAIIASTLRTSLEPVPVTFEATVQLSSDMASAFIEGQELKVGLNAVKVTIVYAQNIDTRIVQSSKLKARRIIALHSASVGISYRLQKAVIRENATLSEIYAACGAQTAIGKDFSVSRFYAYQGDVPSAQIAQLLQEEGGVVVWNAALDKVEFYRLNDLFKRKTSTFIPVISDETQKSGFLERHEIPAYFSVAPNGSMLQGDFSKPRAVAYSPQKSARQLYGMSQVLLNVKVLPAEFTPKLNAGDMVQVLGTDFVIITAAHDSSLNANGARMTYSMFWLGVRS